MVNRLRQVLPPLLLVHEAERVVVGEEGQVVPDFTRGERLAKKFVEKDALTELVPDRAKDEEKGTEEIVAKGTVTRKESLRARKVTGDSKVDFTRFGLYELLMHAHQNPGDVAAVMVAVKRKAKEIAGMLRLPPKVALVVDNSVSALGSAERRFQPLATMEAVVYVFSNCEGTDTKVYVDNLEDLAEVVDRLENKEFEFAERTINDVLAQVDRQSDRQTVGALKVVDVETDDYIGQAVRKNGSIIDLTLLSRDAAQKGFKMSRPTARR